MYSGTTLTNFSGRLLGAHQKIDKIARRHLERLAPASSFPVAGSILHFEGGNGPDAIKRKSPARDEPWHYIQPFDPDDGELLRIIETHYKKLVHALYTKDDVRAAFEAAWLAHAVVDGLTPAHHYPYEEKLTELMNGVGIDTRTTIRQKLIMPGATRRNQLGNNWKMWGPKGLFTTHSAFEWGFATVVMPLRMKIALPSPSEINHFSQAGIGDWFRATAQDVARLGMYEYFYTHGWTVRLARQVRRELAPTIVRSVTLIWHGALMEAKAMEARS